MWLQSESDPDEAAIACMAINTARHGYCHIARTSRVGIPTLGLPSEQHAYTLSDSEVRRRTAHSSDTIWFARTTWARSSQERTTEEGNADVAHHQFWKYDRGRGRGTDTITTPKLRYFCCSLHTNKFFSLNTP